MASAESRRAGLSKSRILSGLQCTKRLFLETYKRELAETDDAELVFQFGHMVGECARSLWPEGILIEGEDLRKALDLTRQYLEAGEQRPLFEATVDYEGVLVRVDILVPEATGYRLIEVKASTSVKPEHLPDVAVQTYVLEQAGLPVTRVELAHVDNTFVYTEPGNYEGLLAYEDVTTEARAYLPHVPDYIQQFRAVLADTEPDIAMGSHCKQPYDCPFMHYCADASGQPEYPVTILPAGGRVASELQAEGYLDLREVPAERLTNTNHQRVHRVTLNGAPELLPDAKAELEALPYPRYYLDFESLGVPIPIWLGMRPYEAVPIQYSLHIEHADSRLDHHEFLDTSGEPPFRALAEDLMASAGTVGPIFVYSSYEKQMLNQLIKYCPEWAGPLEALIERLYDLLPLVRANYYHPAMRGSWSIKAVLPTIAPELAYETLGDVSHGNAAQGAYLQLISGELEKEQRERIESALRRYCSHDTLAMVRLVEYLNT
ncbi:MAG: DUF2779 domain-containing protein [Gammaproteobacteria bacterium]|nr:DUF2779 domain-containing protein [Gammaproteobacteria bacterium]